MAYIDPVRAAERISGLLLLDVSTEALGNTGTVAVRVAGLERPHGLAVEILAGLTFVYANLRLDSLAKPLIDSIAAATASTWSYFFATVDALAKIGVKVEVVVNGHAIPAAPAEAVQQISLRARALDWREDPTQSAADLGASVTALILSLLPIDDPDPEISSAAEGAFALEGRLTRIAVNHYERSRSNRALAILAHGTTCVACGFSFEENYGELGEGYVEIHHILPVHLMEQEAVVNPLEDLVPLCANCHRMVHRTDPPVDAYALREMVVRLRE